MTDYVGHNIWGKMTKNFPDHKKGMNPQIE